MALFLVVLLSVIALITYVATLPSPPIEGARTSVWKKYTDPGMLSTRNPIYVSRVSKEGVTEPLHVPKDTCILLVIGDLKRDGITAWRKIGRRGEWKSISLQQAFTVFENDDTYLSFGANGSVKIYAKSTAEADWLIEPIKKKHHLCNIENGYIPVRDLDLIYAGYFTGEKIFKLSRYRSVALPMKTREMSQKQHCIYHRFSSSVGNMKKYDNFWICSTPAYSDTLSLTIEPGACN